MKKLIIDLVPHTGIISASNYYKMAKLIILFGLFAIAFGAELPCDKKPGAQYIVGGTTTNITEIPYQVSLHLGSRFICGGSIISATHVLTAAHCVSDFYNERITYNIRVGSSTEMRGGVFVPAKKVSYHPKFSMKTVDYDVAVIELSAPLQFTDSIKPIKLADKQPADGEPVKASGWGCLKENGLRSFYLQSVVIPMVNRKTCENNYKKYMEITPRMICAGVEGKDACQGDSGGPLAYKGTLVGIVSTGVGCARKDFPGIYTNVADPEVRKFIKENANI